MLRNETELTARTSSLPSSFGSADWVAIFNDSRSDVLSYFNHQGMREKDVIKTRETPSASFALLVGIWLEKIIDAIAVKSSLPYYPEELPAALHRSPKLGEIVSYLLEEEFNTKSNTQYVPNGEQALQEIQERYPFAVSPKDAFNGRKIVGDVLIKSVKGVLLLEDNMVSIKFRMHNANKGNIWPKREKYSNKDAPFSNISMPERVNLRVGIVQWSNEELKTIVSEHRKRDVVLQIVKQLVHKANHRAASAFRGSKYKESHLETEMLLDDDYDSDSSSSSSSSSDSSSDAKERSRSRHRHRKHRSKKAPSGKPETPASTSDISGLRSLVADPTSLTDDEALVNSLRNAFVILAERSVSGKLRRRAEKLKRRAEKLTNDFEKPHHHRHAEEAIISEGGDFT